MPQFPGMDPYLEGQIWKDFHASYITTLREFIVPVLGKGYYAVVDERVYVEHEHDAQPRVVSPDVALVVSSSQGAGAASPPRSHTGPFVVPVVMPEEVRERYITIRHRDTREVVTVIELLSPTNKRSGSDGRREYLAKRDIVLKSQSHLVELDLLRGGERLPMAAALPDGDYYAIVSRAGSRPYADVWAWTLRDPLPEINIPLAGDDADLSLDLQAAFSETWRRAGYAHFVDYVQTLKPAASPDDERWLDELVSSEPE